MPPTAPIVVKSEVLDNDPALDAPENVANGDDYDENEFIEDEDGHSYYTDENFRIRQVQPATVVQRTLSDLYSDCFILISPIDTDMWTRTKQNAIFKTGT